MEQEEEVQIEVPERYLMALLLNLISVTGEAKQLRNERDQLHHKVNESSCVQERNFATAHSKADQDQLEPETDIFVTSAVQGGREIVQGKKQSGPGESRSRQETEKLMNEKLTAVNCTDSGITSKSGLSSDRYQQPQSSRIFVRQPDSDISTSSSSKLPKILLSENIDVTSASPGGKSSQLPRFQSETQFLFDGASPFTPSLHEDVFESEISQHSDYQKLQRAISSRQDDCTTNKGKKEMKKTGSHESYFPSDDSNNRKADYQRKPRKYSHTLMSSSNVIVQGKGDNFMMAYLPQLVSKNILNQVARELIRVKKEHSSLGDKEKTMETTIQLLEENLESLRTEVKDKDKMLEEQKRATDQDERHMLKAKEKMLDEQMQATDQQERLKQACMEINKKLDDANRRNTLLEKMLDDERKRFNRDEEHWKKEKAKLEKQIKTQV